MIQDEVAHYPFDKNQANGLLVIDGQQKHDNEFLKKYIVNHQEELQQLIVKHGALLFRNFKVNTAEHFEEIALQIDPELKNNYLGTSPRNSVTKYTFSASELPDYYPIPQHCEMSFLKFPPRKLFFYAHLAPVAHGETPICDFRKVWNDLSPKVRDAFAEKGVKTVRNYDGPRGGTKFDLWKLKRWDEVFQTTDKAKVESVCKEYEIEYEWLANDQLRLINQQPAFIHHPTTGEAVWFNHTQVFHRDAAAIEYSYIAQRQQSMRSYFFASLTRFLTFIKQKFSPIHQLGTHTFFGDGSLISEADVAAIEAAIWKNMTFFSWKTGDILAIDNFSTAHGRMPYQGPREIYVCWASNH